MVKVRYCMPIETKVRLRRGGTMSVAGTGNKGDVGQVTGYYKAGILVRFPNAGEVDAFDETEIRFLEVL